jgi:hypothetical protein
MFLSSLLLPTVRLGICINNRSKQTPQSTLHHIPEDFDIYQHNCEKLKCRIQQIPICTCLYTFRHTQLPSFKPCPPNTVLSPDITYHLFREAVNIPVIASLSGPWSTTWMQLQTRMQINLFLLAGHTVRFFSPCTHKTEQVQSYQVLHIIKQYLHWPRLLQVIFC